MNDKLKSTIRHILTAVGVFLGVFGLSEWTGLIDLFTADLDTLWAAINTIVGFVLTIFGFFKDKTRHDERDVGKEVIAKQVKT